MRDDKRDFPARVDAAKPQRRIAMLGFLDSVERAKQGQVETKDVKQGSPSRGVYRFSGEDEGETAASVGGEFDLVSPVPGFDQRYADSNRLSDSARIPRGRGSGQARRPRGPYKKAIKTELMRVVLDRCQQCDRNVLHCHQRFIDVAAFDYKARSLSRGRASVRNELSINDPSSMYNQVPPLPQEPQRLSGH